MASSKRTLDLDTLTYQDLYMKAQSGKQISSYTIPVIPGGDSVYKIFQYLTPEQLLSTGGLIFTPSTIPDISNSIINLAATQSSTTVAISTLSSSAGYQILSVESTTNNFYSTVQGITYNTAYNTLTTNYILLQGQNIQTLNLQRSIINLGNSISTISSQFNPTFTAFSNVLETTFNQGDAVSSLSTFFTDYYTNISTIIPLYSTDTGYAIALNTIQDASTLVGYNNEIQIIIQDAAGPGVSTLSTIINSTLIGFSNSVIAYDPTYGVNTISSYVIDSISTLSSYYIINAGIPGICSMSTTLTRQYISSILNAQNIAGTPGLCTMSTFLTSISRQISVGVALSQGPTVSTFSTVLQTQLNLISTSLTTVGYTYIILQQEDVRNSLSTLSTSFQLNYNNLASLSTYSTMLPTAYSTINNLFSLQTPFSTIQILSTVEGSNISTTTQFMRTVYPTIDCGPGLSSLSSIINPNFSSLSTSLGGLFVSFSNTINYGISSVRTDPGVSTLSTFVNQNLGPFSTNYNILNISVNTISQQSQSTINLYYVLSTNDSLAYGALDPSPLIANLNSTISTFSNFTNVNQSTLLGQTSEVSSYVRTFGQSLVSSYGGVRSSFFQTLEYLVSSYTTVSTVVESNIYSPTFSTFTTDSITTSNLTLNSGLYISSLGILTSTSSEYPFSMLGGASILPKPDPSTNHILVGLLNGGRTTYINSNVPYTYKVSPSDPGFSVAANDIAYNGRLWVVVGSNSSGLTPIKYTTDPSTNWSNATVPVGSYGVNTVKWSGIYWLAGTSRNSPNLLQSSDGITWSDALPAQQMDAIYSMGWNGYNWVSVGSNQNIPPYSVINYTNAAGVWQNANVSFNGLQGNVNDVCTNGRTWVAVGSATPSMIYSFNANSWSNVTTPQLSTAQCVAWNGDKFLAGGSNNNSSNLMYSFTGINWQYVSVPEISSVNAITWDGSLWNVAGTAGSLQRILTSPDALNWTTSVTGVTTGVINSIGYSSNTIPSINLSNFDIYSGNIPVIMNARNRINAIQSTIYFNDGVLTIRRQDSPNENLGNIGINTTYPQYALDIAVGNARKPAGTTWVTASDQRVKANIQTANLEECAKLVSELNLRTYSFTKAFQERTGTDSNLQYGFIAQEVKEILPKAISYKDEHGITDFHSLDTDQIFKLEFGATQHLLNTIQRLEAQVSTLEGRLK
jgi:hypothetical protein